MSMISDIDRTKKVITQKSFSEGIGHSLVLEMKKNGRGLATSGQKENGTSKPIG